jgi:hypothetical protein
MKQAILDKLAEVEAMLQKTSCDGQNFADDLQAFDSWASEIDLAVRTLAEHIDYYLD